MSFATLGVLISVFLLRFVQSKQVFLDDICGQINGQRVYLELEEKGTLVANQANSSRCLVQFITCPSCVIQLKFRFLNISRNCGKSASLDSCACDYVWVYEPSYEQKSGRQFCGRFLENNGSFLDYNSRTRNVVVSYLHGETNGHAFTLEYSTKRNRLFLIGFPKLLNINNESQTISTPFFPSLYPNDFSSEYVIQCESDRKCRINLIFSDYQIGDSSIVEFFDWNGQRIGVSSGNIFRPPVIVSTGPSLVVRFYGNGDSSLGFKAVYSFILGDLDDSKPNIDCGGFVSNLGGGITMMNMVAEGTKLYNCVWIIRPPSAYFHMKTHVYVKLVKFADFAGSSELTVHQGMTSEGPLINVVRNSISKEEQKEHVVSLNQGFYIGFKGLFTAESKLGIVYAAFNYKDCYPGSDFPCRNLRCISVLLNCDGFNHCGDNSDEFDCSEDPRDRRQWSKTPNFLFPKIGYSDLTTATFVFALCTFGLIGFIFAMALFLYRLNVKTRQRQIQDHIETINAILEESNVDVVEEIMTPDDPPGYEAPPDYEQLSKENFRRCSRCKLKKRQLKNVSGTSRACQTIPVIPESPPPAYSSKISSLLKTKQRNCRLFGRIKCFSDSELIHLTGTVKEGKMTKFSGRSFSTSDCYFKG